ncbi:MAG: chemotaxis protein CheW [Candidatus Tumulicola sp.]
MTHGAIEHRIAATLVDDCWNRIGTRGDGSCPRLGEHSSCPNCSVFEQAAATLLDSPLSDADIAETTSQARALTSDEPIGARPAKGGIHAVGADVAGAATMQSGLVFRIADEWLAFPAATLRQVADTRPIHALPHRRNRVVLGVVNIRGTLTVAASLSELLHIDRAGVREHASRNGYARMLVAAHRSEVVVFPVDEVDEVAHLANALLMPVPTTLPRATAWHACGLFAWRDTTVGLLDADRVFDSLARSLR